MSLYNKLRFISFFTFAIICGNAFSAAFYSIPTGNGVWTSIGNWSSTQGGVSNGTTPAYSSMAAHDTVKVNTFITLTGNLTVSANAVLEVTAGSTLTINGNVDFQNGSFVLVDAGGTLNINGNLNNSNNSNGIVDNGIINVHGNVTGGNGSTIVSTNGNDGWLNVTGTVISNGTGSVFGSTVDCTQGPCNSSAGSPLPIKLIYFRGNQAGNSVKLDWATVTEINNEYFTIERSVNGVNFSPLSKVNGAGNSTSTIFYNTTDNNPVNGTSYYRLKQTDYDGNFSYSNSVAVQFSPKGSITFNVFPNPVQNGQSFFINLTGQANKDCQVSIYDAMGNVCFTQSYAVSTESTSFLMDVKTTLAPGVYFVTAATGNDIQRSKLIVK